MRNAFLATVTISALLTAPVTVTSQAQSPDLNGTAWVLTQLAGHALVTDVPVTMRFENGRVHGSDGCNTYSGPYTATGTAFRLSGGVVSTRKACPEPLMRQADALLGALDTARSVRVEAGRLMLLDEGGSALASFQAQNQDLAGTSWEVTGYNNGKQAVVSVIRDTTLTMEFGADGRVGGSAGCNTFTAAYTASGERVTIGPAAATRKMCPSPERIMEQEAAFLTALRMVARGRIDGDDLELRANEGALAVRARRATAQPGAGAATGPGGGVATPGSATAGQALPAHGLRLPATFTGMLPCADCEGIRHHLDMWPDQAFHLRREWVGRGFTRDEVGRWRVDPARGALILQGGGEMPLQFEIKGPATLRQLDLEGAPIASTLPYELSSDGALRPTDLNLVLGGEMTYLADAARFTECATGRSYPMAMEGDYITAERAYTGAVSRPGGPLYVTFEGAITDRPKMEGEGTERSVVVSRFINVWPSQRCTRAIAAASLKNTYWRIVRLGADPVSIAAGRREPHLLLRSADGRDSYAATAGCNQLVGGFTTSGEAIRFSAAAATLMACPPPLDALERNLAEALGAARRWRVTANTLELFDEAGAPVGLFEAVYL
jgi:heat shock protein HslJ